MLESCLGSTKKLSDNQRHESLSVREQNLNLGVSDFKAHYPILHITSQNLHISPKIKSLKAKTKFCMIPCSLCGLKL